MNFSINLKKYLPNWGNWQNWGLLLGAKGVLNGQPSVSAYFIFTFGSISSSWKQCQGWRGDVVWRGFLPLLKGGKGKRNAVCSLPLGSRVQNPRQDRHLKPNVINAVFLKAPKNSSFKVIWNSNKINVTIKKPSVVCLLWEVLGMLSLAYPRESDGIPAPMMSW